jgi:lipopolysaccharide/colanic/teichoic acid biosynthesis glycosyltransferase
MNYPKHGKRLLDIVLAISLMIICMPVLLVVSLLVRWKLGRPVLFSQLRPGLHSRVFRLYKFRTMRDSCNARGEPLSDSERLTPFGRWLRSTSLDELPELWNVLRGEMSLVGPRPLLVEYLDRYTPQQARRHCVRPGLTGLAQVSGRNAITWEEKFAYDLSYIENISLRNDLAIVFKTVARVLHRSDIQAESHATMPVFQGAAGGERT